MGFLVILYIPLITKLLVLCGRVGSTVVFVLMNFNEDEIEKMSLITQNIVDSISMLLDKKLELFSSTVNNK